MTMAWSPTQRNAQKSAGMGLVRGAFLVVAMNFVTTSFLFGQQPAGRPGAPSPKSQVPAATLGSPQFLPPENGNKAADQPFTPGNPPSGQPLVEQVPATPPFPPLTIPQQQRLGQLLDFWEKNSASIKTYTCRFQRYEYNPTFGPPTDPYIVDEGSIAYAAPDKGEFKVERRGKWQAPAEAGKRPDYPMKAVQFMEHWICDGKSVFELDGSKKVLTERLLPPSMQGMQIADGPLPFMFGASRKKIEDRYWVREVAPGAERKNEIWLEVYPKDRTDAASFQKLIVILDQIKFRPVGLCVFPPAFDPKTNPAKTTYMLAEMQVNKLEHRGMQLLNQFISPKVPGDWKKVVENYPAEMAEETPRAATNPAPRQPQSR